MIIKNESEFKKWFRKNYRQLGFSKIIRDDIGECPDFIMLKKGKKVGVELETLASNFEFHNHQYGKINEVLCVIKDTQLKIPTIEVKGLKFEGKVRTSFTLNKETIEFLNSLVDGRKFRNRSHAMEVAIELLVKKEMEKSK